MTEITLIEEWFKKAKSDLNVAKHSFETMLPKELDIICFHCQQAVEKALKGYLINHNIEPPRVHDLQVLCQMCIQYDNSFSDFRDACLVMTDYAVTVRYPDDLLNVTELETAQALEYAKSICHFCWKKIFPDTDFFLILLPSMPTVIQLWLVD